jgi:CRP-like cAMP-binding protein
MDHSIGTLTPCKIAYIPHSALLDIIDRYPRITRALWRDTLIDAAVFREWMVGLGRRSSYERIARLLCEVYLRCEAVGLTNGHSYPFPITQTELGDATGLSLVHVNRTLQELRGDGLITLQARTVTVEDWEGLKRAGEFDPKYLHLDGKTLHQTNGATISGPTLSS